MIVLAGKQLTDENSIAEPKKVAPVTLDAEGRRRLVPAHVRPYSLTVLRLKARG